MITTTTKIPGGGDKARARQVARIAELLQSVCRIHVSPVAMGSVDLFLRHLETGLLTRQAHDARARERRPEAGSTQPQILMGLGERRRAAGKGTLNNMTPAQQEAFEYLMGRR